MTLDDTETITRRMGLFSGKDVCIANRCSSLSAVAELLVTDSRSRKILDYLSTRSAL